LSIQPALQQLYPVSQVNITTRSAYNYDGPLETSWGWSDLLQIFRTMRSMEGAPAGQIYFGLIPVESNGYSWWPYSEGDQGTGMAITDIKEWNNLY
jgi:hypothetical protein